MVSRPSRLARRASRHRRLALAFVLAFVLSHRPAAARQAPEAELKAAYVFNFVKFVDWPAEVLADPATPLTICVLAASPRLARAFQDGFAGRSVRDRALATRLVSEARSGTGCHVVYVADEADERRLSAALLGPERGVLTVGETTDFCARGGMIAVEPYQGRLRFEVNVDAAERAGLRLSSQLLRLATRIWRTRE